MKRFTGQLLLPILAMAVGLCQANASQKDSENAGGQEKVDIKMTTRVVLAEVSGVPGTLVEVPIYFSPAEGVEVGRLKVDINYVSANLKYSKLDRGTDLENLDLHIDVKDGKNEKGVDTQTLTIIASFPSPEMPPKGIPEGLLGYLTMKISETGRTARITLRAAAEANALGTNKAVQNLRAVDGMVEVSADGQPAAVSCFFFSH